MFTSLSSPILGDFACSGVRCFWGWGCLVFSQSTFLKISNTISVKKFGTRSGKGYQQTTLVDKELIIEYRLPFLSMSEHYIKLIKHS